MERYLRECIDSLVGQTFRDIEIICFNDASTDASIDILHEYAAQDERFVIIDSPVNIKQGGGRNAGIRAARAPYIMFVDPDDWVEPDFVEKYYTKAVETGADIVNGNYKIINEGKIKEVYNWGLKLPDNTEYYKRRHLEANAYIWTNLFRRSLFLNNNLFFPEGLQLCEDNAISSALYLSAKMITKIDDCLYCYRILPKSASHAKDIGRFRSRFKSALIARENLFRIDIAQKYTDAINNLFINSYYANPLHHALWSFDKVLYDEIHFANKTILSYVSRSELKRFIATRPKGERMMLSLLHTNPRLGIITFCMIRLYQNIINKICR